MTLELDGIVTTHGDFELGPIDLVIEREVLAVLGPSGCGKTTLLSTIGGITRPDAGTVTLDGRDLTGLAPEHRGTALVFQDGALFPHMTARENIAYAATSAERVTDLAATLEIESILSQRADTLSGGERQRVALARSLAADPDVLLLDEPLAALDAPIRQHLRTELRDLLSSLGIPVLYVTHDQHEATVLGDRVAVVSDGKLHQCDVPTEVFARPATPFVASFTGSVNLFDARVVDAGATPSLDWDGRRLDVPLDGRTVGDEVQFCLRPEYVVLGDEAAPAVGNNTFTGAISRLLFEGDSYRVDIAFEWTDDLIQATLSPPTYDRLGLEDRERIRVALPADAIHVIEID